MTHDLVIRSGVVVDGTGAPPRTADIAIDGDRIVEIGRVGDRGAREIDADGAVVTPGFVDLHTHLDAQLGWDPLGTSSCWHGVTSVVMGNCGVTFAPVQPSDKNWLAALMESVEDIPRDSILDGLAWDWHTYGEYLDSLARTRLGLNVGGLVGHCALRWYAMGERSVEPGAHPTSAELALMCDLADEALRGGALGLSTSRTLRHRIPDGRHVPGTWAEGDELVALAQVLGRHDRGFLGVSPRFDGEGDAIEKVDSELAWMTEASARSGRPVTFNLTQTTEQGDHWRHAIKLAEQAAAHGARIRPQTTGRGIGVIFGLGHRTPFDRHDRWRALWPLTLDDKLTQLRDPQQRAALAADADAGGPFANELERFFVLTPERGARYECDPEWSLPAVAAHRNQTVAATFIDLCVETDGALVINWPLLNHDFDCIAEMLTTPNVLMGLADAGAHVGQIMDASQPTFFLTYWLRERGLMSLEDGIRRLTSDTAQFAGLPGRGVIELGAAADINVIDFDGLELGLPSIARDFPGDAPRFVQRATGYVSTIVNGQPFMEHGEHTGVLAGGVLRGG